MAGVSPWVMRRRRQCCRLAGVQAARTAPLVGVVGALVIVGISRRLQSCQCCSSSSIRNSEQSPPVIILVMIVPVIVTQIIVLDQLPFVGHCF